MDEDLNGWGFWKDEDFIGEWTGLEIFCNSNFQLVGLEINGELDCSGIDSQQRSGFGLWRIA